MPLSFAFILIDELFTTNVRRRLHTPGLNGVSSLPGNTKTPPTRRAILPLPFSKDSMPPLLILPKILSCHS